VKPLEPKDLDKIVRDRATAIVLGKAFFWDMQAGSDGQACASCHSHAGADHRTRNQLSPGLNNVAGPPKSETFDTLGSGAKGRANYTLQPKDFPFHRLADPNDPNSEVLFDSDDTVSSQGVFRRTFVSTDADPDDGRSETCTDVPDVFSISGHNVRRVEPRNTPTMINAVFFDRLFWDGRANNVFNGVSPFGARDPNAEVLELQEDGTTVPVKLRLENSALASQAVGPILSPMEMSCEGRTLPHVGHKLRSRQPLAWQRVAWDDSVLGELRDPSGRGLATTYEELIQQAFEPKYWASGDLTPDGFTQLEKNFGLFWGLALMLYESTLVSDDAPIDRYLGGDLEALTPQQIYGKALFEGQAGCIACHHGPTATGAAFAFAGEPTEPNPIERMAMGNGAAAIYDNGFYNVGVRPTDEDRGIGGTDPWGNPLSLARQAKIAAGGGVVYDPLHFDSRFFAISRGVDPRPDERDATEGAFKTPSLRNVELTGPFFHNGGYATLEQVVDFYNRGGDRRGGNFMMVNGEQVVIGSDTTGLGDIESNMSADMRRLLLTNKGKRALVAFLKSFTDERVRWERAPFDHPSIVLPNGTPTLFYPYAQINVPAVGAGGRGDVGRGPLRPFLK
jgi:cytochrome c peroxidase